MNLYVSREIAGRAVFGGIGTHVYHALASGESYAVTSQISYNQIENHEPILSNFHSEGFKGRGIQNIWLNILLMLNYRIALFLFILKLARKTYIHVEAPEYMFELIFLVLIPKRWRRNIHITTRLHGSSAYDRATNSITAKSWKSRICWKLEKLQAERSDVIVAPTEFARKIYEEHFQNQINVVFNKFHAKPLKKEFSSDICITFIGSNDADKGIAIFEALVSALPQIDFEAFGNIKFRAANLIVKQVALPELARILQTRRRLLIVPSTSETFGYTFLEGLHYTEHVFASDIPVFNELLVAYKHTNVTLIDPSETDAWVAAAREYVG